MTAPSLSTTALGSTVCRFIRYFSCRRLNPACRVWIFGRWGTGPLAMWTARVYVLHVFLLGAGSVESDDGLLTVLPCFFLCVLWHSWSYIPGAGDDEEHWAKPHGIDARMFWVRVSLSNSALCGVLCP